MKTRPTIVKTKDLALKKAVTTGKIAVGAARACWFSGAEARGIPTSGGKEKQPARVTRRGPPARRLLSLFQLDSTSALRLEQPQKKNRVFTSFVS